MKYYCTKCGKEFEKNEVDEKDKCSDQKEHDLKKKKVLDKLIGATSILELNSQKIETAAKKISSAADYLKTANDSLGNPMEKGFGFISSKINRKKKVELSLDNIIKSSDTSNKREKIEEDSSFNENNASLVNKQGVAEVVVFNKSEKIEEASSYNENNTSLINKESSTEVVISENPFDQLQQLLDPLALSESCSKALQKAIDAQIKILTVIKSPALLPKTYNLILASMKDAISFSKGEEKILIQKNAGTMFQSLVFFQEAQLLYEEKKHSKDAEEMLELATKALQEATTGIVITAATGGTAGPVVIGTKVKVITGICNEIKKGDFSKYLKFLFRTKELRRMREEFYHSLVMMFDKLARYADVFGNEQMLIAETIRDYKDKINKYAGDKSNELDFILEKNSLGKDKKPVYPIKPSDGKFVRYLISFLLLGMIVGIISFVQMTYFAEKPVLAVILSIFTFFSLSIIGIITSKMMHRTTKKRLDKWESDLKEYVYKVNDFYYNNLANLFYKN